MKENQERNSRLPLRHNLTLSYIFSSIIAILLAAATVAGLISSNIFYPTDELLQSLLPSDVAILLLGLPMLLGSMWLTRRGQLVGLLLWPGALFFVLYNYLIYVLAMPLNVALLLHLALTVLSLYALIGLVASIDGPLVQQELSGAVPERLAGGVLAGLGLLFFVQAGGALVSPQILRTPIGEVELATHIVDFLIAPAWVIGGVMIWRRKAFGYLTGLGLLYQASMLFIGLIIFLLVQPLVTTATFQLVDIIVILIMGLVCFIPFGLFLRGVASARRPPSN